MSARPFAALTDPELIEACLKGNGPAWEALLARYQRLIYSIPLRYGLQLHDANDVFQNVSLLLWENLGRVRDRSRLGAWLSVTTRRECWRLLRHRRQQASVPEGAALDEQVSAAPHSEEVFLLLERQSQVRAAIEHLELPCRELLTKLFSEEPRPAYSQIAESLTLPEGSIGPTRSRCLEKLLKILEGMGFADA
jgi:RNA polymerase sigma factor (sigma-70 family)